MAINHRVALGIACIVIAGLLWGAMGTAVQFLFQFSQGFNPLDLVALRQLCAGTVFVLIAFCLKPHAMLRIFKDGRLLANIAFGGVLIFSTHYAFFESIFYSNAGTGAIFLTLVPLFAALWLSVTKHQKIGLTEVVCFVLAVSGVYLIITNGDWGVLQFSPLAIFWGLLSAVFATIYSIEPLSAINRVGVLPVVSWGMLGGGICGLIVGNPFGIPVEWNIPTLSTFAFIVLFGTVTAFWLYMQGLSAISPVMAGLLNCLEPLSAFLFSIALLGDRFGTWQLLGIALVLANVCLLALVKARR